MKFGQYELLERVAVGGMAEVYRGRTAGAEGFEKWVAIKRILPEFARDERFISMMLTEARIHSALSHRNIVQIHDLGISEDGEYFIVLEYVEGHDLRAIMEAANDLGVQIPDSLALHVADELAQALHFAHELRDPEGQPLGIIHRDVSPSNVLISNAGEVKLSDFGIARRRNDHSFVGSLKGNLVYMSPEQARRVPLDRRTDVFSLGAVLFEMLTGQKVREIVDEVSGFRDVASGIVRSARSLRPDLPEAYEALLMRALASDPADRFQDAAAFGAAIRELGRENETPVGPAEMRELVELLNPPRRARSPVERSKVIRLGPEFKELAGQARVVKPPGALIPSPPVEPAPVILAAGGPVDQPRQSQMNGNGSPHTPGWMDKSAAQFGSPTPAPRSTTEAASMMAPTPPPPLLPKRTLPPRATVSPPRFDAAAAAVHALEFSAGNEMQPTPPPPAVQGPYAPDVVTPVATPMPNGHGPASIARPLEGTRNQARSPVLARSVTTPPALGVPVPPHHHGESSALDMAPTPPPRSATYPGIGLPSHIAASPVFSPQAFSNSGPTASAQRVPTPFAMTAPEIPVPVSTTRRRGPWGSIAVALVLALVAGAAVVHFKVMPLDVVLAWPKPAHVAVASEPSGANVTLDGQALPERTPMSIEVRRDRAEHVLEFTREGSLPVRTTTRFDRAVALSVTVTLPAAPPPPPPPPAPEPVAPPPEVVAHAPEPPKIATKAEKRAARKAARLASKKPAGKHLAKKQPSKKKSKKAHKASASPSTGEL